ncbi:MAG: YggS family pyridoxal phosphate-dependent enzyme [Gammaproteobacteria bacterium]
MPTSTSPWVEIRHRIAAAAQAAGRDPAGVALLAVSKGQSLDAIRTLAAQGQRAFGENYVQEALPKIAALEGLDLSWHFIGRLQRNKTRDVAARFDWCHGLDRLAIAERLNDQRPAHLPPLQCCIEVNLDAEPTKGGVAPGEVPQLVTALADLPRLRLRGLMGMPAPHADPARHRAAFRHLRELLAACGTGLDTLSMGTSADFEVAIAEGATIVRIGTAVFGPRLPRDALV